MEARGDPFFAGRAMKLRYLLAALLSARLLIAAGLPPTGPHRIEHVTLLGIELWRPVDRGGRVPLLFSPGLGNTPSQYLSQLEELSQPRLCGRGTAALSRTHSVPDRAVSWAEDILAAKRAVLSSALAGFVDTSKIGAFGHSVGRAAAAACQLDSMILACLNQDGGDDDVQRRRPYWPIDGREFAGAFAMLDWFDPGIDEEDLRTGEAFEGVCCLPVGTPASRLETYRAAGRGAVSDHDARQSRHATHGVHG